MASYDNVHDMLLMVALLMASTGAWVALKYAVKALRKGVVIEEVGKGRRRRRVRVRKEKDERGLAAVTAVAALAVMADGRVAATHKDTVDDLVTEAVREVPAQPIQPIYVESDSELEVVEEPDTSFFSSADDVPSALDFVATEWNPITAPKTFTFTPHPPSPSPPSLISDEEIVSIVDSSSFNDILSSVPTSSRSTSPSVSEHGHTIPFEKEVAYFQRTIAPIGAEAM